MKRNIVVLSILLLLVAHLMSQTNRQGFDQYLEKFKAEKISFLTEKLDLTVEEAQKFWPVYNKYQDKRDEVIRSKRMESRGRPNFKEMNSQELEAFVDRKVEEELKLAEMKLEFHKQIKKIIPIEKVATLYRAENEFMNHMLSRIREKGPNRKGRGQHSDK